MTRAQRAAPRHVFCRLQLSCISNSVSASYVVWRATNFRPKHTTSARPLPRLIVLPTGASRSRRGAASSTEVRNAAAAVPAQVRRNAGRHTKVDRRSGLERTPLVQY